MSGFMGKIRRVNLTDSIISEEEIPEKMAILAEGKTPDHYSITGHDRPLWCMLLHSVPE